MIICLPLLFVFFPHRWKGKLIHTFRFQLFYFSNTVIKAKKDTVLTIDTRGNKPNNQTVDHEDADEVDEDPVEKAIQSK